MNTTGLKGIKVGDKVFVSEGDGSNPCTRYVVSVGRKYVTVGNGGPFGQHKCDIETGALLQHGGSNKYARTELQQNRISSENDLRRLSMQLADLTGYNRLGHVSDDNIAACIACAKDMIQRLGKI